MDFRLALVRTDVSVSYFDTPVPKVKGELVLKDAPPMERTAGVLCPLFSLRSRTSAGIGEIPDLERIAPWLAEARLRVLMLLPLLEAGLGQESPYGPLTAFAIDPIYIGL